jgi:2,5-furandicarboxylate decarboxylase 1
VAGIVFKDIIMPTLDLDRFRLRRFIEELERAGEIERHDEPLDLADLPRFIEHNPQAVLLTAVGPERQELVANVTASRRRLAMAFGVPEDGLLAEVQRRLRSPAKIVELAREEAPVQQVVLTGDDADLTSLPVHLQHGCDGAPYISASLDFIVDPRNGQTNSGIRRMMLRGPKEAGIDLVSPSDFRAIYEANVKDGPFPVAFVVGTHPIDYVSAMMRVPVDELTLVASLRDAPLPVVKCVTNDIRVPADAEWVLEGYLDARGHVEEEGPFGEFLGYYGAVKRNPVFHLTAITRRRDALFQSMSIGGSAMSFTDTAQLNAIRSEVMVWRALETAVREPVRVYATPASGGMFNLRIAIRQRVPGEARNAIAAAFGSLGNVKNVFVFDPDIDIFSDEQVDWALATRFQADHDLVVIGGMRALPLDPSLQNHARIGGKAGFDCTVPFGQGERLDFSVPEPPVYTGAQHATVEAALADGPKFFVELMAATKSRDGREIVRELERLGMLRSVERDREGRWLFGGS